MVEHPILRHDIDRRSSIAQVCQGDIEFGQFRPMRCDKGKSIAFQHFWSCHVTGPDMG